MGRTLALEQDLAHYLGEGWREGYIVRGEVREYLDHLRKLEDSQPYLLLPYVYHLYMGLFSGGQVLLLLLLPLVFCRCSEPSEWCWVVTVRMRTGRRRWVTVSPAMGIIASRA